MAKSQGNFFTLRDLLDQGWTGREVRYALLSVHYRATLNFTIEGLGAARTALSRLDAWNERLIEAVKGQDAVAENPDADIECFFTALDDDLNISAALAVLFETVRDSNRALDQGTLTAAQAKGLLEWYERVNSVLALEPELADDTLPAEVQQLLDDRAAARAAKEWKKSDDLRDELAMQGWLVKDTKDGQRISKS